jgi:hypothetical protein
MVRSTIALAAGGASPPSGSLLSAMGHSRLSQPVPAAIWSPLCTKSDLIIAHRRNDAMGQ